MTPGGVTKRSPPVAIPLGVASETSPPPLADGTVALIWVALADTTCGLDVFRTRSSSRVFAWRLEPVIWTASPGATTRGETPVIFGVRFIDETSFYYLCAAILALTLLLTQNLLRSSTGRAWVAIRDSEIAAQSMGVQLPLYKSVAFAYSAALMGLAGALFAHKIAYLAPDIFSILFSIQLLLLVIVGGLGSLQGAVFGAIFVALLPPIIAILRDSIPATMSTMDCPQ